MHLTDGAGADCPPAPTGVLGFANGGVGKNGCMFPPVTAQFTGSDQDKIVGVSFRAGRAAVGDDTEPPFEAAIPDQALRDELPDPAKVVAQALYDDGRRLAVTAEVRACG